MTHTAIEVPSKTVGEVLNAAVSFSGKLEPGEKLVGTPVVEEQITEDLTLTSKVVSTKILNISGVDTPIGKAVQFSVSGGIAAPADEDDALYIVNVSCTTDATPAQTLHGKLTFYVEAD